MIDYLALVRALTAARVEFVIVGGVAAVLHGGASFTSDLDVVTRFTRENSERLLSALTPLDPRLVPDRRPLQVSAEALAQHKNLYLNTRLGRLDLLGSLPPVASVDRVFETAVTMALGDLSVKVISLELLIEVKAYVGRPKDKQTEAELRAILAARKAQG